MRDALVTHDIPQNSWPTVTTLSTNFAVPVVSALVMIVPENPPAALIAFSSVAANVRASRTSQPMTPDQNTERQTPCAAPFAALRVSSEMCADASYPVCVYIVSRKPCDRMNNQNQPPLVAPPSQPPELFCLCPKTKLADW